MNPDDVQDHYEGSDVPGEFRRLTAELGCEHLSATLIRVPPRSDFEQGTGHPRSHRNEHAEPVEMWAISRQIDRPDATKIDDFWEASADARQHRE